MPAELPTAPGQSPFSHERDNVAVRDEWRLVHLRVLGQKLLAPSLVANEKFPVDEIMATHFVTAQEPVQFGGRRGSIREEPHPD